MMRSVVSNESAGPVRTARAPVVAALVGGMLLFALSSPPSSAQVMSPEVEEATRSSAVMVLLAHSKNKEGDTMLGSGSGFFVNSTGLAITNNHVADPGHKKSEQEKFRLKNTLNRLVWTIVTDSGTEDEQENRADVVYQNERADIAVMQAYDSDGEFLDTPNYLKFLPSDRVQKGMKTWCLGFPGGDRRRGTVGDHAPIAVTWGNIVELQKTPAGRLKMIETDVLANPGNSGGPFVNADGRLVGVLTLGSQTAARTNTTMLVPADIVREMIQTSFKRGKVPSGVDLSPFYDLFLTADRTWAFPMYERSDNLDCVSLESGNRICGKVVGKTVTWPTSLGPIEFPVSALAYVVRQADEATLLMIGGDRIVIDATDASITLSLFGGVERSFDLDEVKTVMFRKAAEKPRPPTDSTYVISGDHVRLSLVKLEGDVGFEAEDLGEISVPAAKISGVDVVDDEPVLMSMGSRVSGAFTPHRLTGTLAWSGTDIEFSFESDEPVRFVIDRVNYAEKSEARESKLVDTLATKDRRLTDIAMALDSSELAAADTKLQPLLESKEFRSFGTETQEQIRFLEAEYNLRSGEYDKAYDTFRRLAKDSTRVPDVQWSAAARIALLDRYPERTLDGQPLKDPAVFEHAGKALAKDYQSDALRTIESIESQAPSKRGEYNRLIKRAVAAEKKLRVCSRLTGGESEEYLVRLWRAVAGLHRNEMQRLAIERQETQEQLQAGAGARQLSEYRRRQINSKIERAGRDIESAGEALQAVLAKIEDAGFIIDDPDK
jgi:S1-C subfamily serine protease